jgi:hypothetical protein
MELAATEKAKVCTSVRRRYLRVENALPEKRGRRGLRGRTGTSAVGRETGAVI